MSLIPGPCCLNCEKKKKTQHTITMDHSVGFICDECYNSYKWAHNEDNQKQHSLLDSVLHTKSYSTKEDII